MSSTPRFQLAVKSNVTVVAESDQAVAIVCSAPGVRACVNVCPWSSERVRVPGSMANTFRLSSTLGPEEN
jgi:hypothetical protein